MDKTIHEIFIEHNCVMKTSELERLGVYYRKLKKHIESGDVERVGQGIYKLTNEGFISDISIIKTKFPDAIISMESALYYYGYIDVIPPVWHLTVENTSARKKFKINTPIIKPHFVTKDRIMLGMTNAVIEGIEMKIYDREKTICDILLHRKKIDVDTFNTAIKKYIVDPKKNVANLTKYAKKLGVKKKVDEILSIWL